jgi:hypothetical protein
MEDIYVRRLRRARRSHLSFFKTSVEREGRSAQPSRRGDVSSPCDAPAAPMNAATSIDFSAGISGALPGSGRRDVAIASALRRCPSGPAGAGAICPATAGPSPLRSGSLRSIPAPPLAPLPFQHVLPNVAANYPGIRSCVRKNADRGKLEGAVFDLTGGTAREVRNVERSLGASLPRSHERSYEGVLRRAALSHEDDDCSAPARCSFRHILTHVGESAPALAAG